MQSVDPAAQGVALDGPVVEHLAEDGRFRIAGESGRHDIALLEYDASPGVWNMHHTWTDPAHRGQGLADVVVSAAMAAARDAGVTVRPTCSYVAHWLTVHPEYADLARPTP